MQHIDDKPYENHERVSLLLPWYVNKTLQPDELKIVERHIGVCLLCKRELGQQQQLLSVVRQPSTLDSVTQASFSRFRKRLNERSAEERTPDAPPAIVLRFNKRKQHRTVRRQPVWALAAMVLLLVLIPSLSPVHWTEDPVYRTLSDSSSPHLAPNQLWVIFKENTSQEKIGQIIGSVQGHITGGPDGQAVYTVGFDTPQDFFQLNEKAARLKAVSEVTFAEPGYGAVMPAEPRRP